MKGGGGVVVVLCVVGGVVVVSGGVGGGGWWSWGRDGVDGVGVWDGVWVVCEDGWDLGKGSLDGGVVWDWGGAVGGALGARDVGWCDGEVPSGPFVRYFAWELV